MAQERNQQAPASPYDFITEEDTALTGITIDLFRNGNGRGTPKGAPSIEVLSSTAGGTLEIAGSEFTYTPAEDFNGQETFEFLVGDDEDVKRVTFDVTPVNDAPVANPDSIEIAPGEEDLEVDVLANDTDDNGLDVTTLTVVDASVPEGFSVIVEAGKLLVTASTGVGPGEYTFSYTIFDEGDPALSNTGEVTLTVTGEPVTTIDGSGQDGYIENATVWSDLDADGVLDWTDLNGNEVFDIGEGESWAITDGKGDFALQGDLSGRLVLTGGTDIATGLDFTGVLRAPAGSTVVSPMTTLVVSVMDSLLAADPALSEAEAQLEAERIVKSTLSIDDAVDLSSYDPIEVLSTSSDPEELATAADVFATGSQILNTVSIAGSAVSGSSGTDSTQTKANGFQAIADSLVTADSASTPEQPVTVDLTSTEVIEAVVVSTAAASGASLDDVTLDSLTSIVQATNQQVEDVVASSSTDGLSVLTEVTASSQVAQGETSDFVSSGTVSGEDSDTYTSELQQKVDDAEVGDVTGSEAEGGEDLFLIGSGLGELLEGGDGNDTIAGRGGNDDLIGGDGDDRITGGEGDDIVYGGLGVNDYNGGAGFDTLDYSGTTVPVTFTGPITFDLASGIVTNGSDFTDTVTNFEKYYGSSEADEFIGADTTGFERFVGGAGSDVIDGGGGSNDGVDHRDSDTGSGIYADLTQNFINDEYGDVDQVFNIERVYGTRYGDTIIGDDNDNVFIGYDGIDNIQGGGGVDVWAANGGEDETLGIEIDLGTGVVANDGYGNAETVSGIENIWGSRNGDTILGDAGANGISGWAGDDFLSGAEGDDYYILGDTGEDTLVDGSGSDYLEGGPDSDLFIIEGGGNDAIGDFEAGETIDLRTHSSEITAEFLQAQIDANSQWDADNPDGPDSGTWFQFLDGSTLWVGHDPGLPLQVSDFLLNLTDAGGTIVGTDGPDVLIGGSGNDIINLGAGGDSSLGEQDEVTPGQGNDIVNLGLGNNVVYAGPGDNTYNGTASTPENPTFNVIDYSAAITSINVDLEAGLINNGFFGTDTVSNINKVYGSQFDDYMGGSNAEGVIERFVGGFGNDVIDGGGGSNDGVDHRDSDTGFGIYADLNQNLVYDEYGGIDEIYNIERVYGTRYDDTIIGDSNDNFFIGADGDDYIVDGWGADNLFGGGGADTFVIQGGSGSSLTGWPDIVRDFEPGIDFIDLTQAPVFLTEQQLQGQLNDNAQWDLDNPAGPDGGTSINLGANSSLWIQHDDSAGQLSLADFILPDAGDGVDVRLSEGNDESYLDPATDGTEAADIISGEGGADAINAYGG
ncbi:hypothetical protein FV139_16895, partial [Parahaliea maris]